MLYEKLFKQLSGPEFSCAETGYIVSNKSVMLYKKVFFFHTRQRPANQEQAKQALSPVIIIQLAPS